MFPSTGRSARRVRRHVRLWLRSLEKRVAPAQLVVTSAADSGTGSLRTILATANSNGEADTITFDPAVTVINLTTGQLTISEAKNLTIDGGGTVTINGAATASVTNRLFNLTATGQPTIAFAGVTLANGNLSSGNGGGILFADQLLQLTDVMLKNNTSAGAGGALASTTTTQAHMSILASIVSGNTAAGDGGAIFAPGAATVTIDHAVFDKNASTTGSGHGGALRVSTTATLGITDTTFTNNSASRGGAICVGLTAPTGLSDITIARSIISGNNGGAFGGGLCLYAAGNIELSATTISDNAAHLGGGITLANVSSASSGLPVSLVISGSTIARNSATSQGNGAGMLVNVTYGETGPVSINVINSTIANNLASGTGGAFSVTNRSRNRPRLSILNCTIAGNMGGQPVISMFEFPSALRIDSSIIAGNVNNGGNGPDLSNVTIDGSHNFFGQLANVVLAGVNDPALIGTTQRLDPQLMPLGNYGGETETMPPAETSAAINRGTNTAGLIFDQRGMPRQSPSGLPDIGAVELALPSPGVTQVEPLPDVLIPNSSLYTVKVTYSSPAGINTATLNGADINISGPRTVGAISLLGYSAMGSDVTATYQFIPPGGAWDAFDSGIYNVALSPGQVFDNSVPAKSVTAQALGRIRVSIAGTFVVDTALDGIDGNYGPGKFSLREAVQIASADAVSADTITFAPAIVGTAKSIALNGQLLAMGNMNILGPGAGLLTLSANQGGQVFFFVAGDVAANASLSGLTLDKAAGGNNPGAVWDQTDHLTVADCVFRNNSGNAGEAVGVIGLNRSLIVVRTLVTGNKNGMGSLYCISGATLTIDGCTITSNSHGSFSGAVYCDHASLFITNTNLIANDGSAVNAVAGNCYIAASTVAKNTNNGIQLYNSSATIVDCTISGNTGGSGGGLMIVGGAYLGILNCTIVGNTATTSGGGIYASIGAGAQLILYGTIVAANTATKGNDLSTGTAKGDNNLVGIADDSSVMLVGLNNLTGTLAAPLDPKLAPLADNGGPTRTYALLPNSPAINHGSNPANLLYDQRGPGFPRVVGTATDIGAFELQPAKVNSVVVNGGAAQRSRVTQIRVNFDSLVALPTVPAAAFQLKRQSDGAVVTLQAAVTNATTTSVDLTFVGGPVDNISLADARYTLSVLAAEVTSGLFDGNGDGLPGDNYVLIGNPANKLFRLFGDSNGDGTVNGTDFLAFRLAFLQSSMTFDFDGSGTVDGTDFLQFRLRFLQSV